jgi:hypothetical protein
MSSSSIVCPSKDVTIACEGLQILGLCSTLSAFEQRGVFIVPQQL